MKTSNKLLLGAFILIVAGMIAANIYLKSKVHSIVEEQTKTEIARDSIVIDSIEKVIELHFE